MLVTDCELGDRERSRSRVVYPYRYNFGERTETKMMRDGAENGRSEFYVDAAAVYIDTPYR